MKNKKQFTLIELIIVIVVIGILAAMALPKFNGVVRNAKLSAMINDKEVLEKVLTMYYQKNDELPLLNEDEKLIIANEGISLSKIVLAEEVSSNDMDTIYKSLQKTLNHYNDSENNLYRIDLSKIKDNLGKDIKYGHKKTDKDFYVYSMKTGNVYYYDYLVNGNGTIQHTEYDTLLKDNELLIKTKSPSLSGEETIINNKPIIELTANLENITTDSIINWEYTFNDEDKEPTKISFILNGVEYDSFDKIPTKLNEGEYTIKLKMQDSKGSWSDNITKTFIVDKNIILKNSIALGNSFSMKIGNDANLYSWGYNNLGQLGVGNTVNQTTPQKVLFPTGVIPSSVVAGECHSMAIGSDGDLYVWGDNQYGQLGITGGSFKSTPVKITLKTGVKPISIFVGDYHSMAIGNDGNLYVWGRNDYGQLGIGSVSNQITPKLVDLPNGVKPKNISLGTSHSMIIGSDGELYTCGRTGSGQLGIQSNNVYEKNFKQVLLNNDVKPISISAKNSTSMSIGDDGNLYVWGENRYGQLGLGNKDDQTTPKKATLPNNVKAISISNGSYHSMIIGDDNNIYSCGGNSFGQLGLGHTLDKYTFTKVTLPNEVKTKSILIGYTNSIALGYDNNLYIWGRGIYGQLGTGNSTNQLSPTKIILP